MRSPFELVEEKVIADVVADAWGFRVGELRYVPEGGGAYHWIAHADDASRWFLTCDDLDIKPWLGSDRDAVFEGLVAAYATAIDLRTAGLSFMAAPIPTASGVPAVRLDERHSVSVFEYVAGEPGRWGQPVSSQARSELVTMLARIHGAVPAERRLARRGLEVPGRSGFEEALSDLERPWEGGPLSELARRELAEHLDVIVRWLAELDRFAVRLGDADVDAVLTHGEPHPGNLIRTATGTVLVDWDTLTVARPERDLWMIVDAGGTVLSAYRDLTGITLDTDALEAYRLLWALADLASFTVRLWGEHRRDTDAERSLVAMRLILNGQEPSPYGAPT